MNTDRILSLITSVFVSPYALEYFDTIAFFDKFKHSIHVVAVDDYLNGHFDNYATIKRVADFKRLGLIYLANPEDFIEAYPNSCIEKYIYSTHSYAVKENKDKYIAAYIHLYKLYKSLDILTRDNYVQFIDSFIDYCMAEGSDHQSTITYSPKQLYRVLRLRKAVLTCTKSILVTMRYTRVLSISITQKNIVISSSELLKRKSEKQ